MFDKTPTKVDPRITLVSPARISPFNPALGSKTPIREDPTPLKDVVGTVRLRADVDADNRNSPLYKKRKRTEVADSDDESLQAENQQIAIELAAIKRLREENQAADVQHELALEGLKTLVMRNDTRIASLEEQLKVLQSRSSEQQQTYENLIDRAKRAIALVDEAKKSIDGAVKKAVRQEFEEFSLLASGLDRIKSSLKTWMQQVDNELTGWEQTNNTNLRVAVEKIQDAANEQPAIIAQINAIGSCVSAYERIAQQVKDLAQYAESILPAYMCAVVDERNQRAQLTSDVKSYNSSLHGFTIGVQELVSLLNGCRSDIKMLQEDLESYSESPNEVAGPSSFPLSAQAIQVPGILAIGAGTYAQI